MDTDPWEVRNSSRPVAIYMTHDEALVLNDFLQRGFNAGDDYSQIEDQAELRVLWDITAILESWLSAPLAPDYQERLAAARAVVRDTEDLRG
jgi:hypothetical protein